MHFDLKSLMATTTATAQQQQQPAAGLLRVFERSEAGLNVAEQKLQSELSSAFQANPSLNPTRLLKRLVALEEELPKLRAAAAKNESARRSVLEVLEQQVANQSAALELARRAQADIQTDNDAFQSECAMARGNLGTATSASMAARPEEGGPSASTSQAAASESSAFAGPQPIDELSWLRLSAPARAGLSLDDVNTFWRCLFGLFVRRETHELQAAQLLALGIRTSGDNERKFRALEGLGLIQLRSNAVQLV